MVEPDNNKIYVWYNDETDPLGPPIAEFTTSSTQVFTNSLVQFNNQSMGNVTSWEWTFEDGTPVTSDQESPAVRYSTAGSFDVQLIASNDSESDTLLIDDFITVSER